VIPSVAVQTGPQGSYVFTVKPDKTVAVSPVTVSFTQNNVASIVGGVAPGDVVVVDGQDKLQAGIKVDPHATGGGPNQKAHSPAAQPAQSAPTGAP
jgi:multidrug efflux system membrane fusion protein